jgi:hypothetical protein
MGDWKMMEKDWTVPTGETASRLKVSILGDACVGFCAGGSGYETRFGGVFFSSCRVGVVIGDGGKHGHDCLIGEGWAGEVCLCRSILIRFRESGK